MRAEAKELGIKVDGRWSEDRIQKEIDKVKNNAKIEGADVPAEAEPEQAAAPAVAVDKFQTLEWANDHAAKIWAGQSPALSLLERVGRIRMALKDKGFDDFDNLVIPTKHDYKRYL